MYTWFLGLWSEGTDPSLGTGTGERKRRCARQLIPLQFARRDRWARDEAFSALPRGTNGTPEKIRSTHARSLSSPWTRTKYYGRQAASPFGTDERERQTHSWLGCRAIYLFFLGRMAICISCGVLETAKPPIYGCLAPSPSYVPYDTNG